MNTMVNKRRMRLSRTLALLLCVLMVLSFATPVGAAGHFDDAKIRTSYGTVTTAAYVLDTPAKNCTSFDLDVEIEMKKNTKCANWDIWVRSGGKFEKVGSLSLPDGNGSVTKTVELKTAKNFDAVAVTPTTRGGYSWSLGMAVYNVSDGSGKSSGGTNHSGSNSSSSSTGDDDDVTLLEGDYEKVKIRTGGSVYNVSAWVLDTPLKNVKSIGVAINVSMNNKTHCNDWAVWVRSGGSFKKVGSIYLDGGDGFTTDTIYFKSATNFDAIAVLPKTPGGYSWSMALGVYNPQY